MLRSIFVVASAALLAGGGLGACAANDSGGGAGNDAERPMSAEIDDTILQALGGGQASAQSAGLRVVAQGSAWVEDQGFHPNERTAASTFTRTTLLDQTGDRISVDVTRTLSFLLLSGMPQTYRIVVDHKDGGISTGESSFGLAGGPMTSARVAATRRSHLLLYPHLLKERVLASPRVAMLDGEEDLEGRKHIRVRLEDEIAPIFLLIDKGSKRLSQLRTTENSDLRRDVPITVKYDDWRQIGHGLFLPMKVAIEYSGLTVHEEARASVEVVPRFGEDSFAMPPEAAVSVPYDIEDGRRGAQGERVLEGFASIGIPMDALDVSVNPTELAPGLHFLRPSLHNQLVVEQANGVVVVEAPLRPERSMLVLDWIKTRFPGKPVTHTIVSHHHQDHAAGARTFAAQGARVVIGSDAEGLWRDRILPATSSVRPDPLSLSGVVPELTAVAPTDVYKLDDPSRPIVVFPAKNGHSADMLLTMVTSGDTRFVFEADLFNPQIGSLVPNGALDLVRALQERGLIDGKCHAPKPLVIVGAHGAAEPFETTLATMKATKLDLSPAGC